MVIWIIGLSASGKTTLGRLLHQRLNSSTTPWLFLDGDSFRNILGENTGFTLDERRDNAYKISRFCQFLDAQKINVIACVLSLFHDNQRFNRDTFSIYKEVYLEVPFEIVVKRDNKQLYQNALDGKTINVVGVDIPFIPPYAPDLILDNSIENSDFPAMIDQIIETFSLTNLPYPYANRDYIEYPESYQYSTYYGSCFYQAFLDQRQTSISTLEQRLSTLLSYYSDSSITHPLVNLLGLNPDVGGCFNREFPAIRPSVDLEKICTKAFLIDCLERLSSAQPIRVKHLEKLIQRFENSKRLFTEYRLPEWKRVDQNYSQMTLYGLFHLVMAGAATVTHSSQEKAIFLNAMLKCGDTLTSNLNRLILVSDIALALHSLKKESLLVASLSEGLH